MDFDEAAIEGGEFLAEGDGDIAHHFHADAGVAVNKLFEIIMFEANEFARGGGDGGGVIGLAGDERDFAEEIATVDMADEGGAIGGENVHTTGDDHIEGIAVFTRLKEGAVLRALDKFAETSDFA